MAKKLYYKIGEACKKLDIQPYVLRYWETEFSALNPDKSKSGQRVYSERDIQIIARIKELLYEEGFTIAGAKKKLEVDLAKGLKPLGDRGEEEDGSDQEGGETVAPQAASKEEQESSEELRRLQEGIGTALDQARELLTFLDKGGKSG